MRPHLQKTQAAGAPGHTQGHVACLLSAMHKRGTVPRWSLSCRHTHGTQAPTCTYVHRHTGADVPRPTTATQKHHRADTCQHTRGHSTYSSLIKSHARATHGAGARRSHMPYLWNMRTHTHTHAHTHTHTFTHTHRPPTCPHPAHSYETRVTWVASGSHAHLVDTRDQHTHLLMPGPNVHKGTSTALAAVWAQPCHHLSLPCSSRGGLSCKQLAH